MKMFAKLSVAAALLCSGIAAQAQVNPDHAAKVAEALPAKATATPEKPRKVLIWNRAVGFKHSSIPIGTHAAVEMGKKSGAYEAVVSNDLAVFAPDSLKQFDAVIMMNTTGPWITPNEQDVAKLTALGADKNAIELVLRKSLMDFVENGGGLVGFHSASDANYHWPEFGKMVGGYFNAHPWHEKVRVKVEKPDHVLSAAFEKKDFDIVDEIYQFKEPYSRDNIFGLLSLDTANTNMNKRNIHRKDGDFGVAWIREQGKGRVFYSSLGHREEIFWNPVVMRFYLDGIQYAIGDLKAPAKPDQPAAQ